MSVARPWRPITGAGPQLAMKDLEIRGAGNLLGGEQSGHIAGVGFDLYLRLVGEAVANYRGEKEEREVGRRLTCPSMRIFPHTYDDSERLRLQAYRQIAAADTEEKIAEAREGWSTVTANCREAVENLLAVATVRMHARAAGIHELVVMGPKVRVVTTTPLPESRQMQTEARVPGSTHAQPKGMDTWLTLVPPEDHAGWRQGPGGRRDAAVGREVHQLDLCRETAGSRRVGERPVWSAC